jgi:hypothetical protein
MAKLVYYIVCLTSGLLIAYFMQAWYWSFIFGLIIAWSTDWSWRVLTLDLRDMDSIRCMCTYRPGETKIWCCNICGKPTEEFWSHQRKEVSNG